MFGHINFFPKFNYQHHISCKNMIYLIINQPIFRIKGSVSRVSLFGLVTSTDERWFSVCFSDVSAGVYGWLERPIEQISGEIRSTETDRPAHGAIQLSWLRIPWYVPGERKRKLRLNHAPEWIFIATSFRTSDACLYVAYTFTGRLKSRDNGHLSGVLDYSIGDTSTFLHIFILFHFFGL